MKIEVRGLTKKFGSGTAVGNVSFVVNEGELLGLLGPSGSGKTTVLRLIAGLEVPTSGDIFIDGKRVNDLTVQERNIGFVFQSFNLIPVLTAAQNVELPLLLTHLSGSERKKRVATALRIVGLEDRMEHYPRQMSGGQEQRVAIARAIVNDPKIIVADEPTGDLDRKSADDVLNLMDKLNKEQGKTIFMVTHDPAAAERAKIQRKLDKGALV